MMNHSSRISQRALFLLSGVLFVLLGAITAQGATYYVATTGNDSSPGTLSRPFRTFARAVDVLQPGDTLYIRGGLYTEQIDLQRNNKTGTAGAYITIAGYPSERPIIRYASSTEASYGPIKARGNRGYLIFENFVLDGVNDTLQTGWSIAFGNHHFIARNIEIKNFKNSGLAIGGNDIQIINCKIHDQVSPSGQPGQRFYGIYWQSGSNGLIDGNEIYNNPGGGIQIYPGPVANLVVRNNSIHDNNPLASSVVGGILVQGKSTTPITNTKIYNNLVYRNGSAPTAVSAPGIQINAYANGTKVWNNTVYENKSEGIILRPYSTNTTVQNNISYHNRSGNYLNTGTDTIYDHNLTTDPRFVNSDVFDFRLQAHSPAIRCGVILSEVSTDIRGLLRSSGVDDGYDLGAYAFDGSDSNSPSAPRNVSIK